MKKNAEYFDRDLSWLSFNQRVLMEAEDSTVPLYERIKFLAIYSSNLDEFYRVRIAALRSIVRIDKKKINKPFGLKPKKLLDNIRREIDSQQEQFGRIKRELIIPELRKHNVYLYRDEKLLRDHFHFVEKYFKSKIMSYLQPVIMTGKKSKAPYLDNRALYFAIELKNKNTGDIDYAHLNIPAEHLTRFVKLPEVDGNYYYMALDDIIRHNLPLVFPYHFISGAYAIKLNRDADLNIDDEYSGDLVKKIKKQIKKRNLGVPSRFLYDAAMPDELLRFLLEKFDLVEEDITAGGRYHNMHDLFELENPKKPQLEYEIFPAITEPFLDESSSMFDAIDQHDIMLHFPYHSFDYVLRFFNEAALDAQVEEIKVTFYRIASESFISNALISAAHNGKKVTVFVEIKARFDEENNIKWAEKMEQAGINIIYSIPGLKVHAKVGLVSRRNKEGELKRYGFFGTGNFNEKTATVYADEALITCHEEMTGELEHVFLYLTDQAGLKDLKHLLVAQFNLKDKFLSMIDREIDYAKAGKKARMIIKLNNLQEQEMIDKLYEASQAGVEIDLIIRAICCLIPGKEGLSENIKVRRIVDRYLEHSRICYFFNGGREELFVGSADWMNRNIDKRIEVVFPIYNSLIKKELIELLKTQLSDNVKAVFIDDHLKNIPIRNNLPKIRAQVAFHRWLKSRTRASGVTGHHHSAIKQ